MRGKVIPVKRFEGIVAGFRKTLSELDLLVKTNDKQVIEMGKKISTLEDKSKTLEDETTKAVTLKANLLNLLGEPPDIPVSEDET